jgi:LmbE family N-acetylglucosaminyl deacetylase
MAVASTLDVIAVGAHPDDCEIGCGGTLALLVEQGYRVGIVDLTDGEPTPRCDDRSIRIAEAMAARDALGIHERVILDLPNRRLFDSFDARVALAREFRRFRPSVVLCLGAKTPLASPDHWQAMQITEAALFYSRLSKWDEHFGDLPPHPIQHLMYYTLSFEQAFESAPSTAVIVDISATLEKKENAIRCYLTQFPAEKSHVFLRVQALAHAHGSAAGYLAGERLIPARTVGTRHLMSFLNGGA